MTTVLVLKGRRAKKRTWLRGVCAAALLVAGACSPVSPHLDPARSGLGYNVSLAERTLAHGFASIIDRHLDKITAADIAVEGMRGLSGIDPDLVVARDGAMVSLWVAERRIAEYPAPAADDPKGWARLTVSLAVDAAAVSEPVRKIDMEGFLQAVFDATLTRLDVFSRYAGAKEARDHRASRNGFGGIGIRFELAEGRATIVDVIPDTPAAQAGLRVGDVIAAIDGAETAGRDRDTITALLRGPESSTLELSLLRGRQSLTTRLTRTLIVPPTVTASRRGAIGTVRLSGFNQHTAEALKSELARLDSSASSPLAGLILDMRGNPGGLLDQAVSVVDGFVADGAIVSTRGRHPLASQSYDARPGDSGESLPLVVLVDGKSASAAEIVASALQDAGRAVVVGTNSYGKGTVQTVIRLPNDGEITLTWSRFHAPSGYALHGLGVLPSLCTAGAALTLQTVLERQLSAAEPAAAANLARWRASAVDDAPLRQRLRAACPADQHLDSALDEDLAARLLADPQLYARAIAVSAPPGAMPQHARAPAPARP